MPQSSAPAPDEYEEWLDRVRSTYESVSFSCVHRLGDRALADRVSAQVVAGMLTRPGVFRFFGLPYSARIGHLAEARIAAAKAGDPIATRAWPDMIRDLRELSHEQRHVFVLNYVRGNADQEIADELGISTSTAQKLRDDVLHRLHSIAGTHASEEDSYLEESESM